MSSLRLPSARATLTLVPLLACTAFAGMTGQAAAAPPTQHSLAVSAQPDRSSAQPLSGRTFAQPQNIHVFATPATGVRRVRFYLDDTTMSSAPSSIESIAPFDFVTTAG